MAATTIDSLVVTLGLDSSEFDKRVKALNSLLDKTGQNAEETGKRVQESGTKAADFFGQMQKAAIKFFAVLTVGRGLTDFTRNVVSAGAQLDRVSGRLGTSADTLSRWQGAVRQSGGTGEDFLNTLQGLSSSLTELKLTGNTGILPYLQALGVAVADADGKARPLEEILGDIGDKLTKLPNKADAFNIGKNLNIDEGTINLLLKGTEERNRLLAAQKGYSAEDARAAREAQEKWEGVKLRIERTTQAIVIKLLPALEKLSGVMEKFADKAVPILLQVIDAFTDLDKATDGWSTTLLVCLATLRLIGGGGVIGGILRLGGAINAAAAASLLLKGDVSEGSKAAQATAAKATAGGGDREAAISLARTQLNNQWWRTLFGGKITEQDVQERADQIQGFKTLPDVGVQSRAQRNNNPGNLEFRGQLGAVPENGSGRFAKFGSAAEGVSALVKQLQRYGGRGLDTLNEIVNKYAPSNENDTGAYIAALSKRLGVGADQKLDLNNPDTLTGLVKGISRHEAGNEFLSDKDVMSGLNLAGVRGSQQQGTSMSIGEVKVYTQATEANGIARDLRGALIRQADTGIQ